MSSYYHPKVERQPVTIYGLLRHVVNTMTFTSEEEKGDYLTLIDRMEAVNMFGTMAQTIDSGKEPDNV